MGEAPRISSVSRQLAYQWRNNALGLCALCPQPLYLTSVSLCRYHLLAARAHSRRVQGNQRWRAGGVGRPPVESRRCVTKL